MGWNVLQAIFILYLTCLVLLLVMLGWDTLCLRKMEKMEDYIPDANCKPLTEHEQAVIECLERQFND